MRIAYLLEWPGVTQEQYDAVVEDLELGGKAAPGGVFHVAGPTEGGWRVVDVWESPEIFDAFLNTRLGPVLAKNNLNPPQVSAWPVHNTLAP
jgi:hypothetical protein